MRRIPQWCSRRSVNSVHQVTIRSFNWFGGSSKTATSVAATTTVSSSSNSSADCHPPPAVAMDSNAKLLQRLRHDADHLRARFARATSERRGSGETQVSELAFDVVEAEVALVDALSQSEDSAERREALFRGDEAWKGFGLGSKGHHNAKTATFSEERAIEYKEEVRLRAERICQRLMSAALHLRDKELATQWDKRLRAVQLEGANSSSSGVHWGGGSSSAAGLSPAMAAGASLLSSSSSQRGNARLSPNDYVRQGGAAGSRRKTGIPHAPSMGMRGQEGIDDDDDDDDKRSEQFKNISRGQSQHQQTVETPKKATCGPSPPPPGDSVVDDGPIDASKFAGSGDPDMSPSDRARENIMQMMRSQQRSVRNAQLKVGGKQKHVGRSIDDMKHDLMVEDHPMVRSLFRKKPDVGPRWT